MLALKQDFPALQQVINNKPLVYLDSAATTQKPQMVLDSMHDFYCHANANVHRGVHTLSQRATQAYEQARDKVKTLLNAKASEEIIFCRGATEAINLVAQSFLLPRLEAGDNIILSVTSHHANIVPWQQVCEKKGASIRVLPALVDGSWDIEALASLIDERTRMVAVGHVSNAIGTIYPVEEVISCAKQHGVPVLLDGAQALAHIKVDVQALDCDFYAGSAHKMYGPTGIGALYGKKEHLDAMPPYQGGGDMILSVNMTSSTYNELPHKFEAGTQNIAGAVGFAAAIDYLQSLQGQHHVHEAELYHYATLQLKALPFITLLGTEPNCGILSMLVEGVHPHDVGTILDQQGIAVRTGHHCAMPLMQHFAVPATVRASLAVYNDKEDVDALIQGLEKVQQVLAA